MIEQMGNWANQIFWVIFILGLCIFSHELGHFIAAKLSQMQVNEFAFGFGPLIKGFRWGETTYAIRAVPFGGQVNIAGMEPGEEDTPPSLAALCDDLCWRLNECSLGHGALLDHQRRARSSRPRQSSRRRW